MGGPGYRRGWLRTRLALATLAALCLAASRPPPAHADAAPAGSVPLPLTGRQTVRADGHLYVIDGKQVIPAGAIIRVEANVHILGINGASLEVKGGFLVHGTQDCWVRIEKVDFSPSVSPDNELHFDMADLVDCTFVTPEQAAFDGGFTFENSALQSGCKFALRIRSGFFRFMTANVKLPVRFESVPEKGKVPEIAIRTSWMHDVTLLGPADATVRDAELKGTLDATTFDTLIVDGCDLFGNISFHQPEDEGFGKLQLLKCNLSPGSKIVLARPTGPKTSMEKVRVEKFYFDNGDEKPDTLDKKIKDRIDDGADDDKVSVKAFWQNPADRKHYFLSDSLKKRRPPAPE